MKLSVLSSGSSGNCFYIENRDRAILVDAGISCKQIVQRLGKIGRSPGKIRGVFITHEHTDHLRGADVFSRNFNIPIFATKKTAKSGFLCSDESLINTIKNDETVKLGEISVEAFSKSHRASDPVSYNVFNGRKVSIITDLGRCCNNVVDSVSDSNLLCLEANHDIAMLENGPYPWHLKKWISSDSGHLSNTQAGLLLLEHGNHRLKNILLSHLSQTNNTPEIAFSTVSRLIRERSNFSPRVFAMGRGETSRLMRV
ncbi:MAG: MBL fold metallo-hydrolase [Nanoarchaeota archaeon]|nr:MBL fold metallo-hydrolase [Nanoarchaeota archaeon]MBU4086880.1 MBL fold metallo-hydrolase [Nanoarchaeota archaeon]